MPFQIFRVKGASELDSSPVAQISRYPLEERDYKPYAQCNLCLGEEAMLLRMWAFEVSPPPGSKLQAVLYLLEDKPDTALSVTMTPEEGASFSLYTKGSPAPLIPPPGFRLAPHSGEDLQGVYWGGLAALPLSWLGSLGKVKTDRFAGNFYKLCDGPFMAHKGSFFPANFLEDPFARGSMGDFLTVSR